MQLPQSSETRMQKMAGSGWLCRYGYLRSTECREAGDPGQDYLTIEQDDRGLRFVICDGVSQSYYGNLAAKLVGDRLLSWLSAADEDLHEDAKVRRQALDRYMRSLTSLADTIVQQHRMPPHIQGLWRDVLTEKKDRGSATMYCGGRIDFPRFTLPRGRLLIVWQGDIRCRIWNGAREETMCRLGERFDVRQQWNSKLGPLGDMPHVYEDQLIHDEAGGELLIYTDGLQVLDTLDRVLEKQLSEYSVNEAMKPSSDDMSYIQVNWHFNM